MEDAHEEGSSESSSDSICTILKKYSLSKNEMETIINLLEPFIQDGGLTDTMANQLIQVIIKTRELSIERQRILGIVSC